MKLNIHRYSVPRLRITAVTPLPLFVFMQWTAKPLSALPANNLFAHSLQNFRYQFDTRMYLSRNFPITLRKDSSSKADTGRTKQPTELTMSSDYPGGLHSAITLRAGRQSNHSSISGRAKNVPTDSGDHSVSYLMGTGAV